jgi:uncharacterized protein YjiS (DUF1127 family)
MNSRIIEEQIGLFPHATPSSLTREAELEAIRLAAVRARDEAIAQGVRRFFRRIGDALAAIGYAITAWPERHRTYENLRSLSDRELADIGLTRGDICHVFDPDFRMPAKAPANPGPRTRAAAATRIAAA